MKTSLSLLTAVLLLSFAVNAETVEVGIAGNDTMQFDKKAFTVVSGDTVKITFKNTGNLPKIAMGHNLLILAKGVAPSTLAGPSAGAAATEYIPASMKDKILAHTKLLGPQESDTITFTAPAAGSYYFMCSFPGHFALMNGIMTVK